MSPRRSTEPSGLVRMTICSNSATEARRPLVWMLSCNCWSLEIGRAPIRPTAACTFCDWIALMTSAVVRPRPVSRSVRTQARIE